MNETLKTILKVINYMIVLIVLVIAFLLVGIKIFGFKIYTVLSGSMEPNYHVGSLVYVKKVEQNEIKEEDTITFYLSESTIATHRIKEIVKEDDKTYYRTKGDANEEVDAKLTPYEKVIGKVIFTIPLLGYLSTFIQRPPGNIIAIVIGVILIVTVFVIDYLTENKKENKKAEVKNEKKGRNNN